MYYISTRDPQRTPHRFSDILMAGLAPDGGLFLPADYPAIADRLGELRELLATRGYAALVAEILKLYIEDIPAADLEDLAARAYTAEAFGDEAIVSLSQLDDDHLLIGHISEGPTAAFKDMAMQLLGELFEYELERRGERLTILGATSGDTGSSAEYAMRGRGNIDVFMLTPAGRMTPFQQAQMFSLDDANIHNIALAGTFDDCQDVVKAVNADAEFKRRYRIGTVNSINFARILAQVAYYVALYLRATGDENEQVSFAVPTGNFGNVYAGYVARRMGLPIDRLIVATNENDVLDTFFATGAYERRGDGRSVKTSSPSMDITRPSNFERFVFDLLGRDAGRTAELFGHDVPAGGFTLGEEDLRTARTEHGFLAGSSRHVDRLAEIKDVYERLGVLVDPHTADGLRVARSRRGEVSTPIIVLETALPVKFAETITEATGSFPEVPERFATIESGERYVDDLPNDVAAVKSFIADHTSATD